MVAFDNRHENGSRFGLGLRIDAKWFDAIEVVITARGNVVGRKNRVRGRDCQTLPANSFEIISGGYDWRGCQIVGL